MAYLLLFNERKVISNFLTLYMFVVLKSSAVWDTGLNGSSKLRTVTIILQEALLSQRGRAMLRLCHQQQQSLFAMKYLQRSLVLLVTSASDLPMRTIKFCFAVFGVTLRLPLINKITNSWRFVVRLLRSTKAAAYCYQRWVSPTCHGPAALCLQQVNTSRSRSRCSDILVEYTATFSYPTCIRRPH